jgi:hypothetical protein
MGRFFTLRYQKLKNPKWLQKLISQPEAMVAVDATEVK